MDEQEVFEDEAEKQGESDRKQSIEEENKYWREKLRKEAQQKVFDEHVKNSEEKYVDKMQKKRYSSRG